MKHKSNEGFVSDGRWNCWLCYKETPTKARIGDKIRSKRTGEIFTIKKITPSICYEDRVVFETENIFSLFYSNEVELL